MTPERREILEKVARGELTPEEADRLLSEEASDDGSPAHEGGSSVRRVRVVASFGTVSVVGDPNVAEAEIDGIHSASVDGDTLVIQSEAEGMRPGVFAINIGGRKRAIRVHRGDVHTAFHTRGGAALRLRVNPSLDLDVRLDAGPLAISGMSGAIRARSSAGPITIDGSSAPLDVAVNAGAIRINGLITEGESRVRSDAGAIRIELQQGSSVEIHANAALGKVVLPNGADRSKGFGSTQRSMVGEGTATLRVETAMGSIHVSSSA